MAEKRRSGIPRLVSTTRSSNIGIENKPSLTSADVRTIPSLLETKSLNRKSCHVTKLDSVSEGCQMQALNSSQMCDVTSNRRERVPLKTNGDLNESEKPSVTASNSMKTRSNRRMTNYMPPKKEPEMKFKTKQQLQLDLQTAQVRITKLEQIIQEKEKSHSDEAKKSLLEKENMLKELEANRCQLLQFKTSLELQGIDSVSLQRAAIENQRTALQRADASALAKELADLMQLAGESGKKILEDLNEINDNCPKAGFESVQLSTAESAAVE